jgi:hypothetical protein
MSFIQSFLREEKSMEKKIYNSIEEARDALDRGETVYITPTPFCIDPALLQLVMDLQAKEWLEEWKRQESQTEQGN